MMEQVHKRPLHLHSPKRGLSLRELAALTLNSISIGGIWAIIAYETLSILNWLINGSFLHNNTCRLVDTVAHTHYCLYPVSSSMVGLNRVINVLMGTDIVVGLVIVIGLFGLAASLVGPQDKWTALSSRER